MKKPRPNASSTGSVRRTITAMAPSKPSRITSASAMPICRVRARCASGSLLLSNEMKIRLSMPSTTSITMSVASAAHAAGSAARTSRESIGARSSRGGLANRRRLAVEVRLGPTADTRYANLAYDNREWRMVARSTSAVAGAGAAARVASHAVHAARGVQRSRALLFPEGFEARHGFRFQSIATPWAVQASRIARKTIGCIFSPHDS